MIKSFFAAIVAAYMAFVGTFTAESKVEKTESSKTDTIAVVETISTTTAATTTAESEPSAEKTAQPPIIQKKAAGTTKAVETSMPNTPLVTPVVTVPTPAPSVPAVATGKLEISNIRAIPSAFSSNVKWSTNLPSNGKITYWQATGGTDRGVRTTVNLTEHEINLATIDGTTYNYIIEANTSDGKVASSEQREFKSLSDFSDPKIESIGLSRNTSTIQFKVNASEPVKVHVIYSFTETQENDAERTVKTSEYNTSSTLSVAMPAGWVLFGSRMQYYVTVIDRAGNSVKSSAKDMKFSEIDVTY